MKSACKSVSYELREFIHSRDGYACQYCGVSLREYGENPAIEHVVPRKRNGLITAPYNLVSACYSCNGLKRTDVWIPRNFERITSGNPEWQEHVLSIADVEGQLFAMRYRKRKTPRGVMIARKEESSFVYGHSSRKLTVVLKWGSPECVYGQIETPKGLKNKVVWCSKMPIPETLVPVFEEAREALIQNRRQWI